MPENRIETVKVHEITFTVEGDFEPYVPGRTDGPPELCYPAEGGNFEEYKIKIGEVDVTEILDADVEREIVDKAEEQAVWGRG